jgi:hypothetical protein
VTADKQIPDDIKDSHVRWLAKYFTDYLDRALADSETRLTKIMTEKLFSLPRRVEKLEHYRDTHQLRNILATIALVFVSAACAKIVGWL